jgi:hypothetical protein
MQFTERRNNVVQKNKIDKDCVTLHKLGRTRRYNRGNKTCKKSLSAIRIFKSSATLQRTISSQKIPNEKAKVREKPKVLLLLLPGLLYY